MYVLNPPLSAGLQYTYGFGYVAHTPHMFVAPLSRAWVSLVTSVCVCVAVQNIMPHPFGWSELVGAEAVHSLGMHTSLADGVSTGAADCSQLLTGNTWLFGGGGCLCPGYRLPGQCAPVMALALCKAEVVLHQVLASNCTLRAT